MFKFKVGIVFIIFIVNANLCFSQSAGIRFFEGSWMQTLAKAEKEKKGIFLDGFADWCIPCREMSEKIFTLPEVGEFFNVNFVSVKMDMEKVSGKPFKDRFGVVAYPTLLILNSKGYKLDEHIGGMLSDSLLQWARGNLKDFAKVTVAQQFDAGSRDEKILNAYFQELLENHQAAVARQTFLDMLMGGKLENLMQPKYWNLITVLKRGDFAVAYALQNRDKLYHALGKKTVDEQLATIFTKSSTLDSLLMPIPLRKRNQHAYDVYIKDLAKFHFDDHDQLVSIIDFYLACKNFDYPSAGQIITKAGGGVSGWQSYRFASIANALIYNRDERSKIADILAAGRQYNLSPYHGRAIKYRQLLNQPKQENAVHDHTEILDVLY